jgi:hypothetical protein
MQANRTVAHVERLPLWSHRPAATGPGLLASRWLITPIREGAATALIHGRRPALPGAPGTDTGSTQSEASSIMATHEARAREAGVVSRSPAQGSSQSLSTVLSGAKPISICDAVLEREVHRLFVVLGPVAGAVAVPSGDGS